MELMLVILILTVFHNQFAQALISDLQEITLAVLDAKHVNYQLSFQTLLKPDVSKDNSLFAHVPNTELMVDIHALTAQLDKSKTQVTQLNQDVLLQFAAVNIKYKILSMILTAVAADNANGHNLHQMFQEPNVFHKQNHSATVDREEPKMDGTVKHVQLDSLKVVPMSHNV